MIARPLVVAVLAAATLVACSANPQEHTADATTPSPTEPDGSPTGPNGVERSGAPSSPRAPVPTEDPAAPGPRPLASLEAVRGCEWDDGAAPSNPDLLPLLAAVRTGDVAGARALVESGHPVDEVDEHVRLSPLVAAIERGCDELVTVLLDAGADPDLAIVGEVTPLITAAARNDSGAVARLLDEGADVHIRGAEDQDAFMRAMWRRSGRAARLLVEAGADVHARRLGMTPAEAALIARWPSGLDLLEGAGVELEPSLYYHAVQEGHRDMLELLLDRGVDSTPPVEPPPSIIEDSGDPAVFARRVGHNDLADLLEVHRAAD